MSWIRLTQLVLWTVIFLCGGLFLFDVHMMGDCYPGPRGASCWADKEAAPRYFLIAGSALYLSLTWLIFFACPRLCAWARRRRDDP